MAPRHAETSLLGASVQEPFPILVGGGQRPPRALQERSKRPPRDLQAAKTGPRALQEALGSILGPFREHFRTDFGVVLEPS